MHRKLKFIIDTPTLINIFILLIYTLLTTVLNPFSYLPLSFYYVPKQTPCTHHFLHQNDTPALYQNDTPFKSCTKMNPFCRNVPKRRVPSIRELCSTHNDCVEAQGSFLKVTTLNMEKTASKKKRSAE